MAWLARFKSGARKLDSVVRADTTHDMAFTFVWVLLIWCAIAFMLGILITSLYWLI
jgi:hypothetical protein